MMWVKILFAISLWLPSLPLQGQHEYSTSRGVAVISGSWAGEDFKIQGVKTDARLNYETARVVLRPLSTDISTGIDSMDKRLKDLNMEDVRFEGKLNIDIVQTQDHPLQTFEVEGQLIGQGWSWPVHGKGTLEHTYYQTYACMLSISLHIELKNQTVLEDIPELGDELIIQLKQSVLKNE